MARIKRVLSILLFAVGVLVVFAGLNGAVGFSTVGILSSATAIAALLYSGAVWFGGAASAGPPASETILVYDRSLRLVSGGRRGQMLSTCFPASVRGQLESRCLEALAGSGSRFSFGAGEARQDLDAVPVRSADGMIVYGLLITTAENTHDTPNHANV
jgi:hypothetical protein